MAYKNNLTLKTITFAYRFASFVKSVPFQVSSTDRLFQIQCFSKWYQLAPWYIANWIIYLYGAFQPISFILNLSSNGWTKEASLHTIQLVLFMLGVLYQGSLHRKPKEFVEAVNGVYELIQLNPGIKLWKVQPWFTMPLLSFCIIYFGVSLIGSTIVQLGLCIFNSGESRYIFSLLPESIQQITVVWILTIGLQFIILLWIHSLLMVAFCYYCSFFFQVIIWLIYMKSSMLKSRMSERIKLLKFYRKLQVLSAIHNDYGRDFTTGFLVVIGTTETLFLYCTLKSYDLLSVYIYWIYPAFSFFILILMCLLPSAGTIMHNNGNEFIATIRSQTGRRRQFLEIYLEAKSLREVDNAISHFSNNADIGCSQVVMNEVFNQLLLLLSF